METELLDDSSDEILPEARIFDARVDDIWNTQMEAYEDLLLKREEKKDSVESDMNDILIKISENQKNRKLNSRRGRGRGKGRGRKLVTPSPDKDDESPPRDVKQVISRRKFLDLDDSQNTDDDKQATADVSDVNLPPSAKKRLLKLQLETEEAAKRVEEETRRILSSCDIPPDDLLEENDIQLMGDSFSEQGENEMSLKIRYLSRISKIKVGEKENFDSILKKVANLFGLKVTEILLCIGDKNIKPTDTPMRLKIKFYDVIDCIPFQPKEIVVEQNVNKFLLKIQSNDTRKKTEIYTHKLEKFEEVMKRYAELRKMSLKNLVFEFDGEKIEGSETPSDLDMETGSCIDVRVLNYKEPRSKRQPITHATDNIPQHEMLDICVLD